MIASKFNVVNQCVFIGITDRDMGRGVTFRSRNDSEAAASPKSPLPKQVMIHQCLRQLGSSGGFPLLGNLFSGTVYFSYKAKALQKFFQRLCSPSYVIFYLPSFLSLSFSPGENVSVLRQHPTMRKEETVSPVM